MWLRELGYNRRISEFFCLGLSHDNLTNHYQINFAMMQHYNYNLSDLEGMMPWERQIYIELLKKFVEDENTRLKESSKK